VLCKEWCKFFISFCDNGKIFKIATCFSYPEHLTMFCIYQKYLVVALKQCCIEESAQLAI